MTMGELDWVGAAPLDASAMARLRKDLILQRTVLWIPTGLIIALMMLFLFGLPLGAREAIAVLAFATFLGLVLGRLAGDSRYRQIRIALLRGLDIAPLLEQEGRGITARFLGLPGGTDVLDIVMRPKEEGELAKEKDPWGRVVYRTRGADPKGPAAGSGADTIDARMPRIDGMTPRPEFDGLEGDLTEGEKLIEEANEQLDVRAQEAWQTSEASDPDLIEAGVERLGDLVAEGHFEESEAADAFPSSPERADPNTPPPLRKDSESDPSQD